MTCLPLRKLCGVRARWALCLGSLPIVAMGCVDPKGDYEEFLQRPVPMREAGVADVAQSPCQEILAGDAGGKFYGSCLVRSAGGLPFALAVNQTVRPSSDGMTGEIDISFTPLNKAATTLADTAGTTTMLKTVPLDSECRYREDVGSLVLPAAASSLDRDVETTGVVLRGKLLSTDRSCSELDGTVTLGMISLNGDGDTCIYVRAPDDNSIPTISMDEYLCDPSILLPR